MQKTLGNSNALLIIADEGSEVMYMEGCTAPKFETSTLHSAVVELVALKGAKIQYVTVQNWSNNVFNLVTKRALAEEEAEVRWIDCNIGSRLTMKYPGVILRGKKSERRSCFNCFSKRRAASGHRCQNGTCCRRNH